MDFWGGLACLRHEGYEEQLDVRVYMDDDFDLKIEAPNNIGYRALLLGQRDDLTIELPDVREPTRVYLSHGRVSGSGEDLLVFTPKRSPIWKRSSVQSHKGRATLINFGGFDSQYFSATRIQLEACGWQLTILPMGGDLLSSPWLRDAPEFKITHHLEFERSDRAVFSDDDMLDFVGKTAQFFSFCHGGWVAVGFTVGLDEGGVVTSEEWEIGRIGPQSKPNGFLDRYQVRGLMELYPLFMEKVADEGWLDAISHIVYWLRRADIDNAGVDGGIVLLQAALERFAWHLLVRHKGALSEKGFGDLTAADQMRLMISSLDLPRQVPGGLVDLSKFASANGLDAAEAFTRVRNRIVHPPKSNRKNEQLPYYDTYRLGRWYAQLAVLAACGYKGEYSNCTRKDQWVGQVEKVPWVVSS